MPAQTPYPFTEFELPTLVRQDVRRIPKAEIPAPSLMSRHERVSRRNRVMTARYYYWTEIKRRRFDDTVRQLSENEFFVEERTITNALIENDGFFRELSDGKAGSRELRGMFPGFDWD